MPGRKSQVGDVRACESHGPESAGRGGGSWSGRGQAGVSPKSGWRLSGSAQGRPAAGMASLLQTATRSVPYSPDCRLRVEGLEEGGGGKARGKNLGARRILPCLVSPRARFRIYSQPAPNSPNSGWLHKLCPVPVRAATCLRFSFSDPGTFDPSKPLRPLLPVLAGTAPAAQEGGGGAAADLLAAARRGIRARFPHLPGTRSFPPLRVPKASAPRPAAAGTGTHPPRKPAGPEGRAARPGAGPSPPSGPAASPDTPTASRTRETPVWPPTGLPDHPRLWTPLPPRQDPAQRTPAGAPGRRSSLAPSAAGRRPPPRPGRPSFPACLRAPRGGEGSRRVPQAPARTN